MSELPTEYYFIHNFETAVDQPDYVWDMEYPDEYYLYYEDTVLDPDAKFGNYGLQLNDFELYYEPDSTTDEFWPPLTYEFWFKASVIDEYLYGQIWLYGWLGKPEVGWPTQVWFDTWFDVTPSHAYMEDRVADISFNDISKSRYDIPFPLGEYVHYALVVLPDRIKVFYNGVLFKEYISPMPDGFNVMYTDFYLYHESGAGKILIDAFSIAKGEKYTENFNPSAPVFIASVGQYNEGDHMAYAPGDSGGTAVWREAGTSLTPITDIHRPGCGYWFKETGTVYGGEVGPWVPWNVDQKVEFNEGSRIVKSPAVSGGTPIWEVGKTGPAITDTHVPCGYWNKK